MAEFNFHNETKFFIAVRDGKVACGTISPWYVFT